MPGIALITGGFILLVGLGIGIAALFGAFAKSAINIPPASAGTVQPAIGNALQKQPSVVDANLVALAKKAPLINFDNPNSQEKPENLADIKQFVDNLAKVNDMVSEIDAETGAAGSS